MLFEAPSPEDDALLQARLQEVRRIADVLRSLVAGQGAVVEITGEPGIGKTSMLGLLACRAAAAGARVVRGHAVRGATEPGQVVRDVLDALEVRPASTPETVPGLNGALRSALGRWAAGQGGVLALDNMHLCDEQSAALVAQLVRTPVPGPFVLALAHRSRQSSPLLVEALEHGAESGGVIRLELSPLDLHTVSTLLGHWRTRVRVRTTADSNTYWEAARQDSYAEQLHAVSGGNPRIVRMLAAARWDPDEWPWSAGPDRNGLRHEAVSLMTELNALSKEAVTAVGVAAVLGAPFLPDDVATVSGLGLETTLGALAQLAEADLVQRQPWGGRYAFRHPVVGHVALEHARPSLRLPAHRRALDLLVARRASGVARAQQAEHLVSTNSVTVLQALAEGAAEIRAESPATAARWLRLALDCLPTERRISTTRISLTLDCCQALTAVGRLQEARSLAHDLLLHHSDLPDDLRRRTYALCGEVERLLGHYQEAEAFVCKALDLLPRPLPIPLPLATAELVTTHGRVQIFKGTYGQAHEVVREAAAAADQAVPALRVLAVLGATQLGLLDEAAAEATGCSQVMDALPDATAGNMPEVLGMLGCAEMYLERFDDAYRHLGRGVEAATGGTRRHIRINQLVALAQLDEATGRLADAERRAGEAEQLARSLGADDCVGIAMTLRAAALMWTRSRRDTVGLIEHARKGFHMAAQGQGWRASSAVGIFAHLQLLGGDPEGCLRTLVEAGGEHLQRLQRPCLPSLLALSSAAALRCGDRDAALSWVDEGEVVAGELQLPLQWQYICRARAALHAADGEHDPAARMFQEAAESFRQAGMPLQYAWTLVAGARSAHSAHGTGVALGWLETAVRVSRAHGALRIRETASSVRSQLLAGRAPAPPAGDVSAPEVLALLTEREREIGELAAAGKRSKEIAGHLFVSTRTVESHLQSIYRKLEISSRAALFHVFRPVPETPSTGRDGH